MFTRAEAKKWTLAPVFGAVLIALAIAPFAFSGESEQPAEPAPGAAAEENEMPPVVAKVEDEEITGDEFQQAMMAAMRMKAARSAQDPNRDPSQPPASLGREDAERVLQSLIRSKVIYVLAKKADITVSDEEVNEAFAEAKERMGEDRYKQLLQVRNMTEEELKKVMREQLVSQKFYEEKTKDVTVSDEEVKEAYDQLKEAGRMDRPETADVAHILILAPRDGSEEEVAEAKKEIDAIRERIVEGKEDFGEVAKEVSEDESSKPRGGTYEDVPRGRMVPEFEERMFEIPLGEVSEPFQSQYGWHILKVSEREEAGTMALEDVEEQVRNAVETRAKGMAFNAYLESAINDLDIEIMLPLREEAAEPAGAPEAPEAPAGESEEPEAEDVELPDEPA